MLFNSMTFLWLFLPVLILVYFVVEKRWRNYVLLIFSLIFYAWGEPKYIFLMLVSIIVNYGFGRLIDETKSKNKKRMWLVFDIVFNLGLLGYFKYFSFLLTSFNNILGGMINVPDIALPIGISFYTFQIMSYVIDLYRGEIRVQKNIFKLALYITFFPQLIAGPIVKYHDIDRELEYRQETPEKFAYGIKRFVIGLTKKVLLADTMAIVADTVFESDLSGVTQWMSWFAIICYSLQIFFDFSGYSDMAIGLGSMFGFHFPENFNLPYISGSVTEFWRRWHISLSTWFKEYLYIPLGGNRKGKIRTYINLWIVFIATGVWHGAAWSFVAWGIFQGFFIFIERLGLKKLLDKCRFLNHIYLILVMMMGWVIFRAPSLMTGLRFIKIMFFGQSVVVPLQMYDFVNHKTWLVLIVGILLSGIVQVLYKKIMSRERKGFSLQLRRIMRWCEPIMIGVGLLICIMMIVNNTYSSFIYFRF